MKLGKEVGCWCRKRSFGELVCAWRRPGKLSSAKNSTARKARKFPSTPEVQAPLPNGAKRGGNSPARRRGVTRDTHSLESDVHSSVCHHHLQVCSVYMHLIHI